MSSLNMYLNSIKRKQEELARLKNNLAKESDKKASQSQKIVSARNVMAHTSSLSILKSKATEIGRAQKEIANIDKHIADINRKIATKEKELASENKKYYDEQARERKRNIDADKKLQQQQDRQMRNIKQTLLQHSIEQGKIKNAIAELQNLPDKITVLFMASNPINTTLLRLDEEARSIQETIRKSDYRDSVKFETRWAVRPLDLLQAINEIKPTIIHFSGHGTDNGEIVLQSEAGSQKLISPTAITQTIATVSDQVRLIFFNTCFSALQAESVTSCIEASIGMSNSIGDKAACVFSAQFYSAIGFGLSVKKAFDQAIAALMLECIPEDDTQKLYLRDGVNAEDLFIVSSQEY